MFKVSLSLPHSGDKIISFSSGNLAKQANGAVCVTCGETVILVTACMSKEPKEARGFFPLTVEYRVKTYAMGKIPGGYIKKEGRPKDTEILNARLVDRSIRPLFPDGFLNEVQVVAMLLSSDAVNDPDVLAVNGASAALICSDIPFEKPVAAVRVCKVDGKFVVNPGYEERDASDMDVVVVGTEGRVTMIEAKLKEVKEEDALAAIEFARPVINDLIKLQLELKAKIGKPKKEPALRTIDETLLAKIKEFIGDRFEAIYGIVNKEEREEEVAKILSEVSTKMVEDDPELATSDIKEAFYYLEKHFVRGKIIRDEKRPDSRKIDEIRQIKCEVGALPRTHGSAVFTRGQTQALAIITLGTSSDAQTVEGLEGESMKHFMLDYAFPPFSVGEVKPVRGPSRREVGHGALAEKSLFQVIPPKEKFPYTIRVVSEILESNGSSSMASVCAASLALMDAGVPIEGAVAGIALGLVVEDGNYKILTDIAGVEDYYGDMDFKVAGTESGLTAIQLDVKIEGLDFDMIKESLERAHQARCAILQKMQESLAGPRQAVSQHAPKIKSFKIDIDKIGAVIGPGGKTIRKITRDYNVDVDIEDEDGTVFVVAPNQEDLERAAQYILDLVRDVEVGDIYEGRVKQIRNFGAFCEILPGKSGLLHVSEMSDKFVKDPHEHLAEGDVVKVKVIGIDNQGRINLSRKQVE